MVLHLILESKLGLKGTIHNVPQRPFKLSMKLTTLAKLSSVDRFSELETVYNEALV